jgi:hypothetical protein
MFGSSESTGWLTGASPRANAAAPIRAGNGCTLLNAELIVGLQLNLLFIFQFHNPSIDRFVSEILPIE